MDGRNRTNTLYIQQLNMVGNPDRVGYKCHTITFSVTGDSSYSLLLCNLMDMVVYILLKVVWWQNGDLGLGWVLEYIQRFIVDSG